MAIVRFDCVLGMVVSGALWATSAVAQITPDSTLPNNSIVTPDGSTINITGGTQAGGNLFHSFQEFSVLTGNEARFNNTVDIQNIISRVTGGSLSNIDGLIRANGTANLFLINPNGIVFGNNARLNIGGSLIASTAHSLRFADGTVFSATSSVTNPLLTISVPTGLQFGSNQGTITLKGVGHDLNYEETTTLRPFTPRGKVDTVTEGLSVQSGQSLALVGGNVVVEGGILKAPSGRIEIVSVGSNQSVNFQQPWKLSDENITSFGDIQVSGKSFVSTTGDGGGEIAIAGRNISLAEQSLVLADNQGNRNGGAISIKGDSIDVNQTNISSNTYGAGNGGLIRLNAKNMTVENKSGVSIAAEESTGNAGEIQINADSLIFKNKAGLNTNTYSQGNAGRINIAANSLELEDGGMGSLANFGSTGNAGDIIINVAGPMIMNSYGIQSDAASEKGKAGTIDIRANSLSLENSGILSRNFDAGQPGEIKINIEGSLELLPESGINTNTFGASNGGNISIRANSLRIESSGVNSFTTSTGNAGGININVSDSFKFQNGGVNSQTFGMGNAGTINIYANSFEIDQAGMISDTSNTGNAGEININVTNSLKFQNRAFLNTGTSGQGNASNININASSVHVEDASIISNTKERGNAGNININASSLHIEKAAILSNTEENSTGQGGAINLNANSFVLKSAGVSSATAKNSTGNAGDININVADSFVFESAGVSSDTGEDTTGNAGDININVAGSFVLKSAGVSSATAKNSTGNAGDININVAGSFKVSTGSINTDASGIGNAGRITVDAESLEIRNFAPGNDPVGIFATSTTGQGGDIQLNIRDFLLLRGRSSISTNAGRNQNSTGDGGNITIFAPRGFIITVPNENSDITANASGGSGGKIIIRAVNLFGIAPLSRQELARLTNDLDPSLLPTNDITAISQQQNPSLNGIVEINNPDVDPNLGLVELPVVVFDTSSIIDVGCAAFADGNGSEFTITGRGGLPLSPDQPLSTDVIWSDTRLAAVTAQQQSLKKPVTPVQRQSDVIKINPATGWIFDNQGNATLISDASNRVGMASASCAKQ